MDLGRSQGGRRDRVEWRRGDGSYVGGTFYVEKNISGLEYQADQEYDSHFSQYRCWGANFYSLDKFSSLTDSSTPVITAELNGADEIRIMVPAGALDLNLITASPAAADWAQSIPGNNSRRLFLSKFLIIQ